jgi:cleavage and polyadenylation specificity factor subunit 4
MAPASPSSAKLSDDHKPDAPAKPDAPLYDFTFNDFLQREFRYGVGTDRPVCKDFLQGHCPLGNRCPESHHTQPGYNSLVCKHWMRALCKKGDACEFLHEYNLRRMPECNNYARHGTCPNGDDCVYPHFPRSAKRAVCPHYERGFCPLGPLCARRHAQRPRLCPFYIAGFCPYGRECVEGAHPRFPRDLAKPEMRGDEDEEDAEMKDAAVEDPVYEPEPEQDGGDFGRQEHTFGRGQWQNRRRGTRGGFRGRRG